VGLTRRSVSTPCSSNRPCGSPCIRLSDKASRLRPRRAPTKLGKSDEPITPVQQTGSNVAQTRPPVSAFPEMGVGSVCTSSFSRIAQRSLMLRPAHSHGHLCDRHPKASDTSSPRCLPRLLPAVALSRMGLAPTRKRRLCTRTPFSIIHAASSASQLPAFVNVDRATGLIAGLYPLFGMPVSLPAAPRSERAGLFARRGSCRSVRKSHCREDRRRQIAHIRFR